MRKTKAGIDRGKGHAPQDYFQTESTTAHRLLQKKWEKGTTSLLDGSYYYY